MANDHALPPNDDDKAKSPMDASSADDWFLTDDKADPGPGTEPLLGEGDDALEFIDLPQSTGPSTSMIRRGTAMPETDVVEDPLAELPPTSPAAPGSGWIELKPSPSAAIPKTAPEPSDIFSGVGRPTGTGESDVIRNLAEPEPTGSNIFDDPLIGSSRFANPEEGTEDVVEGTGGSIFPPDPGSAFLLGEEDLVPFGDAEATDMIESLPPPSSLGNDSEPDFNRTSVGDSGSNLFADSTVDDEIMFGESGVNLMNPNRGPDSGKFAGAGSSIFGADLKELEDAASRVDVNEIPLMGSSDDRPTEEALFDDDPPAGDDSSNIFGKGNKYSSGMKSITPSDIDLTDPHATELMEEKPEDAGRIDWSLPQDPDDDNDQLSAHMKVLPSELSTDPMLGDLPRKAAERAATAPARKVRTVTPRPDEPKSAKPARDEAPPKKAGIGGKIITGLLGLLLGGGMVGGAYFAGALPVQDDGKYGPKAVTELTGKLTYAESAAAVAKTEAEKAAADKEALTAKLNSANGELTKAKAAATKAQNDKKAIDTQLASAKSAESKATADRKKAVDDLKLANDKLTAQTKSLTDALDKAAALTTTLAATRKQAEEQSSLAKTAEEKALAAAKKAETADAALANVVKELKAAKLVDDKDDAATALAKLPEVIRTASTAATSADSVKAAAALKDALKKADDARLEAAKAKDEAALAKAMTDKAMADAKAASTALAAAKADTEKRLGELRANATLTETRAKAREEELSAKLLATERNYAAQVDVVNQLRKQLSDARSGAILPLSAPELAAREQAEAVFGTGLELYYAGRFADAERVFAAAKANVPNDARVWYYLGLTQWNQGNRAAADASFKKGAELESRGQPNLRLITAALERVQGQARQVLASYRQ